MSKSKLLVLDTNVVIFLMQRGIWNKLIEKCDVHLAQTIIDETQFYDDDSGERHYIDFNADIAANKVTVFEVPLKSIDSFLGQFEPLYADELDPGELEALAYLFASSSSFLICSGDAIVYRTLGRFNKSDQGISLEELLPSIGLSQSDLPYSQTERFRKTHIKSGFQDFQAGVGLRKKPKG